MSYAMVSRRSMTPEDRHALVELYEAERVWVEAIRVHEQASTRQSRLLDQFNQDRLSLSEAPLHPLAAESPDTRDGLSPSDRARW